MGEKTKVGLVYGGKSAEYDVSIQTAMSVINALDQSQYEIHPIHITKQGEWVQGKPLAGALQDAEQLKLEEAGRTSQLAVSPQAKWPQQVQPEVIFPLLHGPHGEDGTVQGLLELLNLPYVGAGVASSAAAMDKVMMKDIFVAKQFSQAAYLAYTREQYENDPHTVREQVEDTLGFPCFIKPANLGSSVGISKSKTLSDLDEAISTAFRYDRKIVIEEHVEGREIEIGILGNENPDASVAGEILAGDEFYDYHAKYEDDGTSLIIPADISQSFYDEIKTVALAAFKALDCAGLARIDFFVRESDQAVLINEVNTMPGFTPYSMFPLLWKHTGISYGELISRLLELALSRHKKKQSIQYTRD